MTCFNCLETLHSLCDGSCGCYSVFHEPSNTKVAPVQESIRHNGGPAPIVGDENLKGYFMRMLSEGATDEKQ